MIEILIVGIAVILFGVLVVSLSPSPVESYIESDSFKPPTYRTWEEHVEEYGPDDPVMKEALISGEVDDPAFRKKHGLSPYDK